MMTTREQLWYTRFLDYANSGIPQKTWCREHGIAQSTFRYWCNKFSAFRIDEEDATGTPSHERWYEVTCRQETELTCNTMPPPSVDSIRLQVRDLKMEFPTGIDPGMLLRIAKGLMKA